MIRPSLGLSATFLIALAGLAQAQEGDDGIARGVNPKDNITKFETILNYNLFAGQTHISTLALKFDYAFSSVWGANVEVPVTHFSGPAISQSGIGDIAVRVRNVQTIGRFSLLSAVELKAPTASDPLLGSGRWQFNPVVGGVYAFDQLTFAFLGYKHYLSFAKPHQPGDINASEVRALLARLSRAGMWALLDVKYTQFHSGMRNRTLDLEFEFGRMVTKSTAISARIGTSFLDSNRKLGLSLNFRKIW